MKRIVLTITAFLIITSASAEISGDSTALNHLESLQRQYIEDRFGMFICYNVMSYGAGWSEANYPIDSINPQNLDCTQWAQAAKSAGMTFGLLTTKHHEGFCLWDSKYTDYDIASTPYQKDVVKQYVDAFREEGLKVGLYYSVWDSTHNIRRDTIGQTEIEFVLGQIRELLTNYGKIDLFVIDGWFWQTGHRQVSYNLVRNLIRELQPDCLVTCHTHLQAMYHVDIPYLEGPFGSFPQENATLPTTLGHCTAEGNGWFWSERTPETTGTEDTLEVIDLLETLESRYCTMALNCMPNRDGLLDQEFIDLLSDIGKKWKPNRVRPPLPPQGAQIIYYVEPEAAFAFSGEAEHAIDASLHRTVPGRYKHWFSNATMPQYLKIDLGAVYDGLQVFTVVPNHILNPRPERALHDGNITKYELYLSDDDANYRKVAEGEWEADAQMKTIAFESNHARYLRLDVLDAHNGRAIVAEIGIGAYSKQPWQKRLQE